MSSTAVTKPIGWALPIHWTPAGRIEPSTTFSADPEPFISPDEAGASLLSVSRPQLLVLARCGDLPENQTKRHGSQVRGYYRLVRESESTLQKIPAVTAELNGNLFGSADDQGVRFAYPD